MKNVMPSPTQHQKQGIAKTYHINTKHKEISQKTGANLIFQHPRHPILLLEVPIMALSAQLNLLLQSSIGTTFKLHARRITIYQSKCHNF